MIRVLHIVEELSAAGIESFIMNNYRKINRNKVQFDFFVLRNENEYYENEIIDLGGIIYKNDIKKTNLFLKIREEGKALKSFLLEHNYQIVHLHYTTSMRASLMKVAKKAKVKIRIYHSHSGYVMGKNLLKRIIYKFEAIKLNHYATDFFACSQIAADWVFTKKTAKNNSRIIKNGININKFKYNLNYRNEKRIELGINDEILYVQVGRFTEQKNQLWTIKLIPNLIHFNENVHFIFLGDGPLKNKAELMVHELNIDKYVSFLGVRNDVYKYLSAADVYIMPSLYEGLPVAAIEAQCSGTKCIVSTNISDEVKVSNCIYMLSLDNEKSWIEQMKNVDIFDRSTAYYYVEKNGYNEDDISSMLEKFYIERVENDEKIW